MSTEGPGHSRHMLTGWGRTAPSAATIVPLDDADSVSTVVKRADDRGVVARGLGRSYGDAGQNAGGVVVDGVVASGLSELDLENGVVTAQAGTSIHELITWLVPMGWFVPVTPGTRYVTVGGAIAADIHGKNHHRSGSWCCHVDSFRLMVGDGSVLDVRRERDHEIFWATAGGMGLTGVILDATIRLKPVETSWLSVDTNRAGDLDGVMALMSTGDSDYDYSVAWIDLVARGSQMGRSILQRGGFATHAELSGRALKHPRSFNDKELITAPPLPNGLLNHRTVRLFNEFWFRKAPQRRKGELQTIGQFFHPLDMVRDWNRIYGPRGFLQWQFVVPYDRADVMELCVERLSRIGTASFLAVLKLFGEGDPAPLSFPRKGWTLALDLPVTPDLAPLLDELDEVIVEAGGRLYLAKDSRLRPEMMPAMYPRLDEWREIRERLDPNGHFRSDLGRRLGLC
jgi:decaprenylphospho-beta-D-ribofuranose 2-oxidase